MSGLTVRWRRRSKSQCRNIEEKELGSVHQIAVELFGARLGVHRGAATVMALPIGNLFLPLSADTSARQGHLLVCGEGLPYRREDSEFLSCDAVPRLR